MAYHLCLENIAEKTTVHLFVKSWFVFCQNCRLRSGRYMNCPTPSAADMGSREVAVLFLQLLGAGSVDMSRRSCKDCVISSGGTDNDLADVGTKGSPEVPAVATLQCCWLSCRCCSHQSELCCR